MAQYFLENRIFGEFSSLFLHECENKDAVIELKKQAETKNNKIRRITRDEAKEFVKKGISHSTRFWVDGNIVKG